MAVTMTAPAACNRHGGHLYQPPSQLGREILIFMRSLFSSSVVHRHALRITIFSGHIASFVTRYLVSIQVVAGLIALVLGFWGWMIEKPPANLSGVLDNLFRTLQLITLQFPGDIRESPSLVLQIARLAVPLVAVLASFQILIASITRPARLALLPWMSGHVVVCGLPHMTDAALGTLASHGHHVVIVAPDIPEAQRDRLEGFGLTVVDADPLQPATMRSLHVPGASALLLAGDDDVANLNMAMLALPALDERSKELPALVLAVKIEAEQIASELDAVLNQLSCGYNVRYHRLSPARESLRIELDRFAPILVKGPAGPISHVLIIGLLGDWEQLAAEVVITVQDHPTNVPVLTFAVDQEGADKVRRWHEDKPELDLVVEITVLPIEAGATLPSSEAACSWRQKYPSPQLALVLRDDAAAIATTFALRRPGNPLALDTIPILVHQSKEDRLLARLGDTEVIHRDLTQLVAIGGLVRVESIERVLDRKGDEAAIALHAHYLDAAKTLGGSAAALQAWDSLPETLRQANRSTVEHAPILFASAGLRLVAGNGTQSVTPTNAELEVLAAVEHRRWIADHIDRGWRFGEKRDDRFMLHPDIRPYNALDEIAKEKDRNTVRVLLNILREQGWAIVRSN
jgi:hypothetical protein